MRPLIWAPIVIFGCSLAWSAPRGAHPPAPVKPPASARTGGPPNRDSPEASSLDYSVVRAFMRSRWRSARLPNDVVSAGRKPRVDGRLGAWTLDTGPELGRGVEVPTEVAPDEVYRDRHGVRLIVQGNPWYAEFILSSVCKHAATLVRRDLRRLRTESGIGLGDADKQVLKRAGPPSRQDTFHGYHLLWYLQKPKHVVSKDRGEYDEGGAAAYVLRRGKVVEIWLYKWDTQVGG